MTSLIALTVGDYVYVSPENRTGRRNSEGGNGYITQLSPQINVKYVIGSALFSPNVNARRIHRMSIGSTGNCRRASCAPRRNLLGNGLIVNSGSPTTGSTGTTGSTDDVVNCIFLTKMLLEDKEKAVRLIVNLNKINIKGWLRTNEKNEQNNQPLSTTTNTHLSSDEKEKIVNLTITLKMINNCAISRMAYAWGITRMTLTRLINKKNKNGNLKRKKGVMLDVPYSTSNKNEINA